MTLNDHVTGQLAQCKSFRDHITDDFVKEQIDKLIVCLQAQKKEVEARLHAVVRTDRALHDRYAILLSIPGIGPLVGLSLLARMPELGSLKKGQSASLLGVAPFDHESGRFKGQRRISGGRHRPRRHLYMAALGAIRTRNSPFRSFSHRLVDKGKPKKVAIVAVMRKLIELANLLLQENRKWALDYHPQAANSSP